MNDNSTNYSQPMDLSLLNDIIAESKEHIESIEMNCLSLENNTSDMELINSLFRAFHSIKGLSGFVNQKNVERVSHNTETLLDGCRKSKYSVNSSMIDIILKSSDYIRSLYDDLSNNQNAEFILNLDAHIEKINQYILNASNENSLASIDPPKPINKIGELMVEAGKLTPHDVDEILKKQKEVYKDLKFGQIAVKEGKISAKDMIELVRTQENKAPSKQSHDASSELRYLKVPSERVDNLVDVHGELLVLNLLINEEAESHFEKNSSFMTYITRMTKMIKDLQHISLSLRMVNLKMTFQKLSRIVRETAQEVHKTIDIIFEGEDVEIDRSVVDKLFDPLMHLVRNSISHGIEEEEKRIEKGKSTKGRLEIKAYSKNGNVYIEVIDDGQGLQLQKIYQKALEKKLISEEKNYSEEDIINFIFLPGFSTRNNIDNVSGRGVGMDVVKTEITKIGGQISVYNQEGIGLKIKLKIPINLTVINGTIVKIKNQRYVIPTAFIKQILNPKQRNWKYVNEKREMVKVKNDLISILPIYDVLGKEHKETLENELLLITELEHELMAIPVEEVLTKQELVVKPLGKYFSNIDYASGVSILGDGNVTIIFDVESLFKINNKQITAGFA